MKFYLSILFILLFQISIGQCKINLSAFGISDIEGNSSKEILKKFDSYKLFNIEGFKAPDYEFYKAQKKIVIANLNLDAVFEIYFYKSKLYRFMCTVNFPSDIKNIKQKIVSELKEKDKELINDFVNDPEKIYFHDSTKDCLRLIYFERDFSKKNSYYLKINLSCKTKYP